MAGEKKAGFFVKDDLKFNEERKRSKNPEKSKTNFYLQATDKVARNKQERTTKAFLKFAG